MCNCIHELLNVFEDSAQCERPIASEEISFFDKENLFDGKLYMHQCFLTLGSIAVIHNKII